MTFSPALARSIASSAVNASLPTAAPGEAGTPVVITLPALRAASARRNKLRQQQLRQIARRNAADRGLLVDQLLLDHVAGDLQAAAAGPLAVAGLQHEQLALLDRELDVLHVLVVLFEHVLDAEQLVVDRLVPLGHLVDGLRRANAGDDVFALGVDQELAVELVLAGGRIAGEGDARAASRRPCCHRPSTAR